MERSHLQHLAHQQTPIAPQEQKRGHLQEYSDFVIKVGLVLSQVQIVHDGEDEE